MPTRNATIEETMKMIEMGKFDLIAKLQRCVEIISDLEEETSFMRIAKLELERQIREMEIHNENG